MSKRETLGQRIKRLRKARGWSQDMLANQTVVDGRSDGAIQKFISQIEQDAVAKPDVFAVAAIAKALGVTIEELI